MTEKKKKEISRRFSKAAHSYDEYALVQKACGAELAASVPASCNPQSILEIGCGTGNYTRLLRKRFPGAEIQALDFAGGLIECAKDKLQKDARITFICEDGEAFLAKNSRSFDLITGNATLQWFDDLSLAFRHISAGLSGGGMLHTSLFGPQTLHELGEGLEALFDEPVILPASRFHDNEKIGQLAKPWFERVSVLEKCYKRRYQSLRELLQYIRKTGTGGYHQHVHILTRSRLKKLAAWFAEHGGFETTYQIYFVSAIGKKK